MALQSCERKAAEVVYSRPVRQTTSEQHQLSQKYFVLSKVSEIFFLIWIMANHNQTTSRLPNLLFIISLTLVIV